MRAHLLLAPSLASTFFHKPFILLAGALVCLSALALSAQSVSFAGASPSVNFGKVNLCAAVKTTPAPCSETLTLTYNVTASGTLGTPKVVTQGAPDLDFTLASGSTCMGEVTQGATCTVNVNFAPKFAGTRPGAVQLTNGSGNVLTTTLIYGVGVGPQIAFDPGTVITLPVSGFPYSGNYPPTPENNALAVDGAGNVFLTDDYNGRVLELPAGGGAQVAIGSGWNGPSGIAVDGADNLFVADYGNNRVVVLPSGGGAPTTVGTGLLGPRAVAVDCLGDLFIGDDGDNRVVEVPAGGGAQTTIYDGAGNGTSLSGQVAADSAGDAFIATSATSVDSTGVGTQTASVVKLPAGGGVPTTVFTEQVTPTSSSSEYGYSKQYFGPLGLAVDGAGDLYIANFFEFNGTFYDPSGGPPQNSINQTQSMVEIPAGSDVQTTLLTNSFNYYWDGVDNPPPDTGVGPLEIALDGAGDLFLSDTYYYYYAIGKVERSQAAPLSFVPTAVGSISPDSPHSVIVENIGNSALSLADLTVSTNFEQVTGMRPNCNVATPLAASTSCNLSISFVPDASGALTGAAVLTDNSLNGHLVTQSIPLSGAASVSAPVFNPQAGLYKTAEVQITDQTPGAKIYYTTNGSMPTASSKLYTGPVSVTSTETINAIAIAAGLPPSPIATSTYTITPQAPVYLTNFSQGFAGAQQGEIDLNGSAAVNGSTLQLTNGSQYEAGSAFYATPVNIQSFVTQFAFQFAFQNPDPTADGFTFTIQNVGPDALGGYGGSLGYAGIGKSVAIKFDIHDNSGEGPDSTGLYVNGAPPTTPAINLTNTGIDLHRFDVFTAQISYDGKNLVLTLTDTTNFAMWSRSFPIDIPAIVGGATAYIGFTSGTGFATSTWQILSWTCTAGAPPAPAPPIPNFPDGLSQVNMTANGSAGFGFQGLEVLWLTADNQNQAGSAFYTNPVNIRSFTTDFTFKFLTFGSNPTGDGITFTIQNVDVGAQALGAYGKALGYAPIGSSVAIKFDLHNNAGEGPNSTGLYVDGALPTVPAVNLTGSGIDLHSNDTFLAHITYDGKNLNLTLTDVNTEAAWSHSFPVNIPAIVGATTAYVGFTGSTGEDTSYGQILTWTFTNP